MEEMFACYKHTNIYIDRKIFHENYFNRQTTNTVK